MLLCMNILKIRLIVPLLCSLLLAMAMSSNADDPTSKTDKGKDVRLPTGSENVTAHYKENVSPTPTPSKADVGAARANHAEREQARLAHASPTPTPSSNTRATHGETKNEVDRKANSKYIGETEKNLRGTAASPTPTPSSDRIKWDGKYVAGRTSASPTAPPRASPANQKKVHDNIVSVPVGPALKKLKEICER